MKRSFRWLIHGLVTLSLLLCVAAVALWARSYWRIDGYLIAGPIRWSGQWNCSLDALSCRGSVRLEWMRNQMLNDPLPPIETHWSITAVQSRPTEGSDETLIARQIEGDEATHHFLGVWWSDAVDSTDDLSYSGQRPAAAAPKLHVIRVSLAAPDWLLVLLSAVPPAIWLRGYWKRKLASSRRGRCRICGYDLRASPDRCPECGTPVTKGIL